MLIALTSKLCRILSQHIVRNPFPIAYAKRKVFFVFNFNSEAENSRTALIKLFTMSTRFHRLSCKNSTPWHDKNWLGLMKIFVISFSFSKASLIAVICLFIFKENFFSVIPPRGKSLWEKMRTKINYSTRWKIIKGNFCARWERFHSILPCLGAYGITTEQQNARSFVQE